MITRRHIMAGVAAGAALAGCGSAKPTGHQSSGGKPGFVTVRNGRFQVDGAPYRYCGTNMWYAAFLGAEAPIGDRDRLGRELDALAALGVQNIRVLASAELSPLKNSITPGFRDNTTNYNQKLLEGLDYALVEMARRNIRAVLYLTNFWEWSGGMMTYLYWNNGGNFINMNDPAHPWPEFPDFTSQFYENTAAVAQYHDYVRAVIGRTNSKTGGRYAEDPTIMAWQLANEPRPGGSEAVAMQRMPAFYAWINDTAKLIKSLDGDHLVCTGSEGLKGCVEKAEVVLAAHQSPDIDYLTAHIWPLNWSWVDDDDLAGTYDAGATQVQDYINQHEGFASQLERPLVIEEFGFPRDIGYDPSAATTFKDRFYGLIYDNVLRSMRAGGPISGSNFWAWSGEGRAQHPDKRFQVGDKSYLGDPPHEPQGWYSVFNSDESTKAVIRAHVDALKAV